MSQNNFTKLDDQIQSALDTCIAKMGDRLEKSFDPQDEDSMRLFKTFCLGIRTRRQWEISKAKNDGTAMNGNRNSNTHSKKSEKIERNSNSMNSEEDFQKCLDNHLDSVDKLMKKLL